MKDDILIVGAGVAGLMTAIELMQAGLKVRLYDTGQAGMESSWAGGGILSPIYPWHYPDAVNTLAHWGTQHYPDYFARLEADTGIDPQWLVSGHLILQTDINTPAIAQWAEQFSIRLEQLDQQQLRVIEPALNSKFDQALWLPEIGQIRNPRLVQALKAYAIKLGVTLSENTEVCRILYDADQVTGIETQTGQINGERVLIAAGAWSGQFTLGNRQLDVEPVKGQMIQFQTTPGTIKRITLNEGRYIIPRKDGKVLTGSTLEHSQFDKSIDDGSQQELHAFATAIYPALESALIINHWAGLRPGNERQTPYIGQHPEIKGLYFNTGHYRNGIILGLASARLCTDIITGNEPILPPEPYALN
ncbi:MAG: glycine oxidase ThiO [Gammaproteobacteria bacterium]|nr:glycine oxidase ThiO [Gammaproteobacteria bacterium]